LHWAISAFISLFVRFRDFFCGDAGQIARGQHFGVSQFDKDVGARVPQSDEKAKPFDVIGGKPNGAANPPHLLDVGLAPSAMGERVHGAARLAGLSLGTGRAPPRLPASDERRLPRAAFRRPAFGAAFDARASRRSLRALQVLGHAERFSLSIVRLIEFFRVL
jgi:hypothetical protein